MTKRANLLGLALCLCVILCRCAIAADLFTTGQKVEVREGDSWSPASVIGHEGRKYQVHYDGSDAASDEWVTPDRIRNVGSASPAPSHPAATAPANAAFFENEEVQTKWGGLWRKSVVVRKQNDWTLVEYDNVWYEWVQPWRVRKLDSTQDTTLDSTPRAFVKRGTPAPADSPEALQKIADPDPFQINPTVGPQGIPISHPQLSGRDLHPGVVVASAMADPPPSVSPPTMLSLNHGSIAAGVNTTLVINPQGHYALLAYTPPDPAEELSVQRVEPGRADVGRTVSLAPHLVALAISPDGRRVITRSDKTFPATKWRLDVWNVDLETPKPLLSFRPYDEGPNGSDAVLWASYLDASHLLTCSGGYTLTLWEFSDTSIKEIYTLQGDTTVSPQMSGGGKYVIVGYGGESLVCDAMTGDCVTKCTTLTDADGMVGALNPSLTRIALAGQNRLLVGDMSKDKVLMDLGLPTGMTGSSIAWVAPNLLLIDSRWIFDIDHRALVWEYTPPENKSEPALVTRWLADRLWYLTQSPESPGRSAKSVLTSISLLDARVLSADKKISDGVVVIQPGMSVSLEVNIDCTADEKTKIIERLTSRLKDAGFTIADNQPIKLVAQTRSVDPRQVVYRSMRERSVETVTVSNTAESLSWMIDSKSVWTRDSTSVAWAPMMVWEKKDVSLADAVKQQNKPRLDWFTNAGIPRLILKDAQPAGRSELTVITGRSRPGR